MKVKYKIDNKIMDRRPDLKLNDQVRVLPGLNNGDPTPDEWKLGITKYGGYGYRAGLEGTVVEVDDQARYSKLINPKYNCKVVQVRSHKGESYYLWEFALQKLN